MLSASRRLLAVALLLGAASWAVPAHAGEVPGFALSKIDGLGSLSLNSRFGTTVGANEHIVNIEDCGLYEGGEIEVTITTNLGTAAYSTTVALAEPGKTCSTNSGLDPPTDDGSGCYLINYNDKLTSTFTTDPIPLDILTKPEGGTCLDGTEDTATLYFLAQVDATQDTTYLSKLEFFIDLARPEPPVLTDVRVGDQLLKVTWTDDANDGDDTTYNVYWTIGDEMTEEQAESAHRATGLTAKSYDIETNVENGLEYAVAVRAVDDADNESLLSDVLSEIPVPSTDFWEAYQQSGGTDTGGFCFIATAAYGTEMAEDLGALRSFRDNVLMKTELGRQFVDSYYRWGAFAAAWLADKPALRAVVRVLMVPFVWFAKLVQAVGFAAALLLIGTCVMMLVALRRRWLAGIRPPVPLSGEVG